MIGQRGRARVALALVAAVSSTVLVAVPASAGETASGSEVSIALVEWKLLPGQITVRPGRVTFVVRNRGTMDHEFVVLRSDRHHHKLVVKKGRAVETGRRGEIPLIRKGATKSITLNLPRGTYILLCNILGHYQFGQYASLRVR